MSEVKRWAINPTGNEIHDISPNWTLENAQAYSDQYGAGYPLVMVVKLNDYEKLKAQLERAEEALNFYSMGWQEGTFVDEKYGTAGFCGRRAREYFKEKESK